MKKLLFFVVALFTTYFAQAQEGIKIGIKAGPNFSTISGDDVDSDDAEKPEYKFGFHAGAFLDYGISDMFSIRPELLYSIKGFKVETNEDDAELTLKSNTHYLELPILARIKTGESGLFFEAGPTFSYLLTAKSKAEGQFMGEEFEETESGTDGYNKLDVGYAAGIGYQLASGLGIGLRYNGGLSKLDEDGEAKVYNSNFMLSLSWAFGGN
ncbi:porin family protein [Rufibacter tibetensis]|uniref:Outer membrane protein beta-barrel domain-containing protein n=1 Tax=Rufibacter tibetensis TaxID=512763 RepID=A0A0P0C2T1_9BACT|nr:porin family protein [Rufibacter tibetensis]ALI99303.1 hypothetical protein DC20_10330 [Rufibacter tibetensis]